MSMSDNMSAEKTLTQEIREAAQDWANQRIPHMPGAMRNAFAEVFVAGADWAYDVIERSVQINALENVRKAERQKVLKAVANLLSNMDAENSKVELRPTADGTGNTWQPMRD